MDKIPKNIKKEKLIFHAKQNREKRDRSIQPKRNPEGGEKRRKYENDMIKRRRRSRM